MAAQLYLTASWDEQTFLQIKGMWDSCSKIMLYGRNMTVYQNIAFGLGNVKEETPTIDFEARKADCLIRILAGAGDVTKIIKECADKKGAIDK